MIREKELTKDYKTASQVGYCGVPEARGEVVSLEEGWGCLS